jgi:hypothetical protein
MFRKQELKQVSAYEKKVTHDMFMITMEWLEKYIEIAHKKEFPDWENRKQIRDNLTIKRTDIYGNPKEAGDAFSTQLLLFESNLKRRPEFIREEIQKEYYQWMSAVGINVNNCPERLKHYLFGINEILEGRGEKIRKDVENEKPSVDATSPEYMGQMSSLFTNTYTSAKDEIETEKSLKGKTHKDWKVGSKFGGGSVEQGQQAFGQIRQEVASKHGEFHFFPQKGQLNNPQQLTNSEIVQDVKQNPNNWRIEEVVSGYSVFNRAKKEEVLIHNSVQLDFNGEVVGSIERQPVYPVSRFNQAEIAEINRAKSISQTPTNQPIRQGLVDSIKQSAKLEKGLFVIIQETGETIENDDWFIHNSLERKIDNKTGYLIFNSEAMIRVKDLSEEEQKAIGYKSVVETSYQAHPSQNRPSGGKGGFSGWGSSIIFASVSVVSLIGLAFAR